MPKKASRRGPKGTPWYRKHNCTWYFPKVKGKAKAILDSEGGAVKARENRKEAFCIWGEALTRKKALAYRNCGHTGHGQPWKEACAITGARPERLAHRSQTVPGPGTPGAMGVASW
jgi:hypothetical protein